MSVVIKTAKDGGKRPHDPCHPLACKLQQCLNRNSFDENKCQDVIREIHVCCKKVGYRTVTCEGFLRKDDLNER
jgi:hypothetical protein